MGAMGCRIAAISAGSYVGFELDEYSYRLAKDRLEGVGGTMHNQLLEEVRPPAADLVCAFEVLEHLEDDRMALGKWRSYIRPGGHLLLSMPAHPHRFGPRDTLAGHFRRYPPGGLKSLVESVGMVDVSCQLYGGPLGYALDAVRNRLDANKLARVRDAGASMESLTAASGRRYQFDRRSWKSIGVNAGTLPFTYLQRIWPSGIGLVALARKPSL
jgi:SAM-dependent methyltransferase